jgi:hypothetical protein
VWQKNKRSLGNISRILASPRLITGMLEATAVQKVFVNPQECMFKCVRGLQCLHQQRVQTDTSFKSIFDTIAHNP